MEVVRVDAVAEIGFHVACECSDFGNSFVVWVTGDYTKAFGEWNNCLILGTSREEVIEPALGRYRRIHAGAISILADEIKVWHKSALRLMDERCNDLLGIQ